MASLGIVILWAGYTLGIFGWAKIKSAYGAAPGLTISDLALPSHRATYIAAVQAWGAAGGTGTTLNPNGTVSGAPAGTPAASAATANVDINNAITKTQQLIATVCKKGTPGYNAGTCADLKRQLASLQAGQGFGSP